MSPERARGANATGAPGPDAAGERRAAQIAGSMNGRAVRCRSRPKARQLSAGAAELSPNTDARARNAVPDNIRRSRQLAGGIRFRTTYAALGARLAATSPHPPES